MAVIVFLVDTSLSMARKHKTGHKYLDLAKNSIDHFIKFRQRDPRSRTDRYMLLTTEAPYNIKVDWDSSKTMEAFYREVKNLNCLGETHIDQGLKRAFDVLNVHRVTYGVDNYGCGRLPWMVDYFSMIILITDNNTKNIDRTIIPTELTYELTKESFRWDERLFTILLDLNNKNSQYLDPNQMNLEDNKNAAKISKSSPSFNKPINPDMPYYRQNQEKFERCINRPENSFSQVSKATGGNSYLIREQIILTMALENIVQQINLGVVCDFNISLPNPKHDFHKFIASSEILTSAFSNLVLHDRKMLLLKTKADSSTPVAGHWPVPENFFPETKNPRFILRKRNAHPFMTIIPRSEKQLIIQNFPYDKYELENCEFSRALLNVMRNMPASAVAAVENNHGEQNQNRTSEETSIQSEICWYAYVLGSDGRTDKGLKNNYETSELPPPFGYIKPNTNLTALNLFVMPYDFPTLLPLINSLIDRLKNNQNVNNAWRTEFDTYIRRCPPYYLKYIKQALKAIQAPPDLLNENSIRNIFSQETKNQLKSIKNEALMLQKNLPFCYKKFICSINGPDNNFAGSLPTNKKSCVKLQSILDEDEDLFRNFGNFTLQTTKHSKKFLRPYLDPFHIPRSDMLRQLTRMRKNISAILTQYDLIETAEHMDFNRFVQISQMGNFQERMKQMGENKLRSIKDSDTLKVKQKTFGNPFKRKSVIKGSQDTISFDEGINDQAGGGQNNNNYAGDNSTGGVGSGINRINRPTKRQQPMTFLTWKKMKESGGESLRILHHNKTSHVDDFTGHDSTDREIMNAFEKTKEKHGLMDLPTSRNNNIDRRNHSPTDEIIKNNQKHRSSPNYDSPNIFLGRSQNNFSLRSGSSATDKNNDSNGLNLQLENYYNTTSIPKLEKMIKQPGRQMQLKFTIEKELSLYKDSNKLELKLIDAAIFLAKRFRKFGLITYLMDKRMQFEVVSRTGNLVLGQAKNNNQSQWLGV